MKMKNMKNMKQQLWTPLTYSCDFWCDFWVIFSVRDFSNFESH